MRTRLLLAAIGVLPAALLFGGCTEGDTIVNSQAADQTGIVVTGRGEAEAPTDTAYLDIGIQVTAANVADARDQAAKAADAVISAIKKNGVDDKDIKTIGLSIQPQYTYVKDQEPKITGYVVTNTVEAKIRKLENVSKIVDDGTAAGGDASRLNSIRFAIDDDTKVLSQAREAAMKNAKAKADELAKLGDVSLGKPMLISEGTQSSPPIAYPAAADSKTTQGAGVSTPVQSGSQKVTVDVQVRWSLK